ncbi:cyclic nucleotide-binding protein [Buttiauxella noackiae ATCC 51607]|uniref:Cyclic nucleotide-binding protein n=1 Tax=Buttiauxella noackiae ATCC 51607 TaxID=1354255 RepID=A0A1B7HG70_9ENTR|nr:helix-turn-helix domain-containing protein [Buttiauxella noackiae]OAT14638.1 cyclic nucleotide-binding protein [Buttiauxella noackiae ATCC 51607]
MIQATIKESMLTVGEYIELSKHAYVSIRKKNQRIDLIKTKSICYLKKGCVSVYRLDNNLLTINIQAPAILGLTQMRNNDKYHYIRCDDDCEIWTIDALNATDILNTYDLWQHAFDILTWHLHLYFQRDIMIIHNNIRGMIDDHLKYIWSMTPNVRANTSIYSFITSRNHVSRSAVHKVIKEMTDADRILINRGKLIKYISE